MTFDYRRNITLLYIVKVSNWFMLTMPIVVLFFQAHGLSMHQIFTLQAIYSVAMVAWEIPGGYLADRVGRRQSILYGAVLGFFAFVFYSFSNSFVWFIFAELLRGFGQSLINGADSALLYDSLIAANRQNDYSKYEGRTISIGNFAEAAAGVIGGFLASISLHLPYYFQAGIAFVAIPASIALRDAPISDLKKHPLFKDVFRIMKFALIESKQLRLQIIFSAITGASTLTMAWFAQPYFKSINLPIAMFGITWSLLNLSVGFTSMYAYKLESKIGSATLVASFSIVLCAVYLLMGFFTANFILIFLLLFYFARGLATPTLKNYINQVTGSDMRATVLSVRNFLIRLIFAALAPMYGWLTDKYTLSTALFFAGAIYSLITIVCLFYFLRAIKRNSNYTSNGIKNENVLPMPGSESTQM